MPDYTPTMDQLEFSYQSTQERICGTGPFTASAEFERAIAQHDREVVARALREAADAFQKAWPVYGDTWLRDRADRIEKGEQG